MPLYEFDAALRRQGCAALCGVDEAGRGPLAGPVYAAAVILPPDARFEGLDDSKKLTEKKRDRLYDEIIQQAVAYNIAQATHDEIDAYNILQATLLAMRRAVEGLPQKPGYILIDGNADPYAGADSAIEIPIQTVIKGDGTSACIAAASILAKVARDRHLAELDKAYPQYQFAKHKGYGTKLHYQLLDAHGPSPVHRRSFLRKWEAAKTHINT